MGVRGGLRGCASGAVLAIAIASIALPALAQDDPFGALYSAPAAKGGKADKDDSQSPADAMFGPMQTQAGKGAGKASRSGQGVLAVELAVGRSYAGASEKDEASLAQIAMLPKSVPAMALTLNVSGGKYLKNRPKIAVAGYTFAMVRGAQVSASAAGAGSDITPRRTTLTVGLDGVSQDLSAGLAQEAYDDLVSRLKGAGYDVVTPEEANAAPHMQSLGRYAGPVSNNGYTAYGPQSAPLIKGHAFETGLASIAASGALLNIGQASRELDAVVLTPKLMVGVVNTEGTGQRNYVGSASVGARVRFSVSPASRVDFVWGNERGGAMPGTMTFKGAGTDERFGVLVKTEDRSDDPSISNAFAEAGMGSVYRQSLVYSLEADPDRFAALCRSAFQGFNTALVAEIQRARAS